MSTDEKRRSWSAEGLERSSTLKRAKAAAASAVTDRLAVPKWAAARIKSSFEEEDWWSGSILEGYWISEAQIPEIVQSIGTSYFEDRFAPEREEELLAGAPPTEEERTVHRDRFLEDVFTNPQCHENDLTFWHVFEVRGDGRNCYLLVASTSRGQGGVAIDVFEFFAEPEPALNRLRQDGVIDFDFLRWRSPRER